MSAQQTLIHDRVEQARAGTNPAVVCRLRSGWVVLGDSQFIPGYALLLADPVVPDLNALSRADRLVFLDDMAGIGGALLSCTDAVRINYEIHGNLDPALHAHVFPRYAHEPKVRRTGPVWQYEPELRASVPFDPSRDRDLMERLREELLPYRKG